MTERALFRQNSPMEAPAIRPNEHVSAKNDDALSDSLSTIPNTVRAFFLMS